MAQYNSLPIVTEGARVEISSDGGSTWKFLPGTASISESGGEAPTRESVSFQNAVQIAGVARPPTVEITIEGYAGAHSTYKTLTDARDNGTLLRFRYEFKEQELYEATGAANTVAIASSTGAVTFAGTSSPSLEDPDYGPGVVIQVGAANYVIDTISESGEAVVDPRPGSDVAATADYKIVIPGLRRGMNGFVAKVTQFALVEAGSEAQVTTSLSLAPTAQLPQMVVVRNS